MIIDVHVFDPAQIPADIPLPDAAERARAASFRFAEDARHWSACRRALRAILGKRLSIAPEDVPLVIGAEGKPLLGPPFGETHFNLSHCRDLAAVAVSCAPVGIDLEARTRATDLLGCEESFCHPLEIQRLPGDKPDRAAALLEIWTAKEAVLKAHGTGLLTPPQEVAVDLSGATGKAEFRAELSSFHIHRLMNPALQNYSAFLASRHICPEIIYHDFMSR